MTQNPYESPTPSSSSPLRRTSRARTIGSILVLLAMLPAAGIACFTICIVVADNAPRGSNDFYGVGQLTKGMLVGALGGAIVFGLMLWWGIALARSRFERPKSWLKSDGTELEAFFISHDNNQATLRKVDGTEIQIPFHQLCDRDREWLNDQR